MTQKEIIKGNILIARFETEESLVLERDLKKAGGREQLHYHDQWNWLMPVVEKIERIREHAVTFVTIQSTTCRIWDDDIDLFHDKDNKLQSTWTAVIEFIEWYNEFSVESSTLCKRLSARVLE